MFKKIVVFLLVVSFLFCFNSVSSFGTGVPSTIKEDIYVLNYDKEIDTLYLVSTTSSNYYAASIYNASPNSFFFKIKSNLTVYKSINGKEIIKNSMSPFYAYRIEHIVFQISNFNFDQKLGNLVIEIFSLQGEKIKEISIPNLILPKGTPNGGIGFPDVVYEEGLIRNLLPSENLILINIIQNNKNFFLKKLLKPKETFPLPLITLGFNRKEIVFIAFSSNWSIFKTQYYILNKIPLETKDLSKNNELSWCKDIKDNLWGFLSYENLITLFCYSEINTRTNIVLDEISNTYLIKKGWNKINLKTKRSFLESKIVVNIDNNIYNVNIMFVENHQQSEKVKYVFLSKKIKYSTFVEKTHKFVVLSKNRIVYLEKLFPTMQHIPSYHTEEKTINVNCEYDEVIVVELTTSLDMIKPTLSE